MNNLKQRFFYVNPDSSPATDSSEEFARSFPVSNLIAMYLSEANDDLVLTFEDSGTGDHLKVNIQLLANKGRESMEEVVKAINSGQYTMILGDEVKKESIISHVDWSGTAVTIPEGIAGTFSLNGALIVSGASNLQGEVIYSNETVAGGNGSGNATALATTKTVSFVTTATNQSHVSLADGITGQIKHIIHQTRSNSVDLVITPENFAAGSTMTSNLGGRGITLIFDGTNWQVLGDVAEFVIA